MKDCCQDIPVIACSVVNIDQRIEPIHYNNNVLDVDSPLSVKDALYVGGAEISVVDNHLNIPARTLINGVPLMSDAFVNDVISLPSTTMINGYYPITEQYFYFYTAANGVVGTSGFIINGDVLGAASLDAAQNQNAFPFIVPEDCVLTSIKILFTFTPGDYKTPIANGLIYVKDTNLITYYTGVYLDIPAPPTNTIGRVFIEDEIEYILRKGDSVGVYIQNNIIITGNATSFAMLGFKIIPPQTSPSMIRSVLQLKALQPQYNRFPFNQIMNSMAERPITLEDQLAILYSPHRESSELYGRSMSQYDYDARWKASGKTIPVRIDQEILVRFLANSKKDGWYVDISSSCYNTQNLKEYGWQGLLVDLNTLPEMASSLKDMPWAMDYLSFDVMDDRAIDVFENFVEPILVNYKFGVATIRYDGNPNVQSRIGNGMIFANYICIFANVEVERPDGLIVMENWYAHPDIIHPSIFQTIYEYPHFTSKSSQCIDFLRERFRF